jgi:hypothetical protein
MYVRFPLSLRQIEDLLHERGIDVSCRNKEGSLNVDARVTTMVLAL